MVTMRVKAMQYDAQYGDENRRVFLLMPLKFAVSFMIAGIIPTAALSNLCWQSIIMGSSFAFFALVWLVPIVNSLLYWMHYRLPPTAYRWLP